MRAVRVRPLREAIADARRLGIDVRTRRGTGELVFSCPGHRPVVQNSRKKDANILVSRLIDRVAGEKEGR